MMMLKDLRSIVPSFLIQREQFHHRSTWIKNPSYVTLNPCKVAQIIGGPKQNEPKHSSMRLVIPQSRLYNPS